jgi:hypothetical protein
MDPLGTYQSLNKVADYVILLRALQKNTIELNQSDVDILKRFSFTKMTYAYQLWKHLKIRGRIISYKSIRKKVLKFKALGLIEVSKRRKIHKTFYYKLSTYGIFYLFYKRSAVFRGLLLSYSDDPIFQYLLYPILKRETVMQIRSIWGYSNIGVYLSECCGKIGDILRDDRVWSNNISQTHIFFWNEIPSDDGSEELLSYLKTRYNFEWLGYDCLVQKLDGDKIIKISKGEQILNFKLNRSSTRASLIHQGKLIHEYAVEKFEYDVRELEVCDTIPPATPKRLIEGKFQSSLPRDVERLYLSLLNVYRFPFNRPRYEQKEVFNDIKILNHDRDFISRLESVINKYTKYYREFVGNRDLLSQHWNNQ